MIYTHYLAESFSWYSFDRLKHSRTPLSAQSLFIAASNSSENGSVSSMRDITSSTSFASACTNQRTVTPHPVGSRATHRVRRGIFFVTKLGWRPTTDKVGQLLGRGLVSKDNRPMKCTTSKLIICRVTNGGPIWSAFYVVSQSKNQAT